jgi:hypothetical protein
MILIFGPGEAKLELKERLSRSKTFSEHTVDLETADKLTDPQIVARVKEHFRSIAVPIASRPGSVLPALRSALRQPVGFGFRELPD